jgi:hypothetical protein
MDEDILSNPKNVKFKDLLNLCIKYFGTPRITGSHHIFKTPWEVKKALEKLEELNEGLD